LEGKSIGSKPKKKKKQTNKNKNKKLATKGELMI
jgi:hypothetical protein